MHMNKLLNITNRQIVRFQWGYTKLISFIGLLNSVSLMITALAISGLVQFTWGIIISMLLFGIIGVTLLMYLLAKTGILQKENRQIFNERLSDLYKDQATYNAIMIAFYMTPEDKRSDDLIKTKKLMETRLGFN